MKSFTSFCAKIWNLFVKYAVISYKTSKHETADNYTYVCFNINDKFRCNVSNLFDINRFVRKQIAVAMTNAQKNAALKEVVCIYNLLDIFTSVLFSDDVVCKV